MTKTFGLMVWSDRLSFIDDMTLAKLSGEKNIFKIVFLIPKL